MKRCRQYIWMVTTFAILLAVSCHPTEVIETKEKDKLQFNPTLGQAQTVDTRAGESDNSILQGASASGAIAPHIVIDTYTGTPGKDLTKYFSDELGYFENGSYWDVNSGKPRFLPLGGMSLYAYYATKFTGKGDLAGVKYIPPTLGTEYPKLDFTVAPNDAAQVDLIAAKVEKITSPSVAIPFRHILSQINFGVKGIDQHRIKISNIRINNVKESGSFDYNTWLWTVDPATTNYPYYFPDRNEGDINSGLGDKYTTSGALDDSKNSYLFGDGGKFGPGKDEKYLYAQPVPGYATKEATINPLHNSLMLLPQQITNSPDVTVTFDFEIELDGVIVRSGIDNTVRLDAYQDWLPNLRYIYIFKFDETEKITFDVIVEPWVNYNGTDGIVDSKELTPGVLFDKYVKSLRTGQSYSVPIGPLTSDFLCDWSLYTMDNSFIQGQQFTLSFENNLPFTYGKSVVIDPPFGFQASPTSLSAQGDVIFTAIYTYYPTSAELNKAISSGSGNYEFSVSSAVKLNEIVFNGSLTTESSLTLHFPTPYSGTPPGKWQLYDGNKTAILLPQDLAVTGGGGVPYSYTLYNTRGLTSVLDWMNAGGANPGGSDSSLDYAARMKTNITLSPIGRYNLAESYKSSASDPNPKLYVPIGKDQANPYRGTFDGNGATVENLYISNGDGGTFMGFFGVISGGKVQNLQLKNVSINAQSFVGGIAGFLEAGTIAGCGVSGSLSGYDVAGIAGSTWSTLIYSCYSTAAISGGIPNGISNSIHINGNDNYYVASSDIGTVGTRVPSIAALNGKTPLMNTRLSYLSPPHKHHYLSGDLDATTPVISQGAPAPKLGGVLRGTFIQNWFSLYWDKNRWDAEMAILATLGMEYLVIDQVMEFSDYLGNNQYMSWYPATKSVLVNNPDYLINVNAADPTLIKCMNACRKHGIKLFIGTFFDKRYWNAGAAVTNPTQWTNCITTSNNIMAELTKFYFNGASSTIGDYTEVLAGWYFPYEVDDLSFKTGAAQTLLKNGIRSAMTCRDGLVDAEARKPYLFSPFMNGNGPVAEKNTMSSTEYADMWRDIIANAGFRPGDILSPQDCIGVGKLTIADLHDWMPKLRDATNNATTGVQFWINIETFGPGANISFLTQQQIMTSRQYSTKLLSFSYPIYYSPESDRRQGDHNAYKRYYDAQ